MDSSNVEDTQPSIHWLELEATAAAAATAAGSDAEWLARCRRRLLQLVPRLRLPEVAEIAGAPPSSGSRTASSS